LEPTLNYIPQAWALQQVAAHLSIGVLLDANDIQAKGGLEFRVGHMSLQGEYGRTGD
jgi:hypothetical protein